MQIKVPTESPRQAIVGNSVKFLEPRPKFARLNGLFHDLDHIPHGQKNRQGDEQDNYRQD